jgi:hypothetical protein
VFFLQLLRKIFVIAMASLLVCSNLRATWVLRRRSIALALVPRIWQKFINNDEEPELDWQGSEGLERSGHLPSNSESTSKYSCKI